MIHACSIVHLKVPFAGFRSLEWYKGKPAFTAAALSVVCSQQEWALRRFWFGPFFERCWSA